MRSFVCSVVVVFRLRVLGMLWALAGLSAPPAYAAFPNFVNFETAPVHPVALGPDGRTLAVCNLPDARVELFDVSSGLPMPAGSVPVGLDPLSARFASTNELWVVNFVSSTISIVEVAARTVDATLETPAGPSDLVFAGQPRRAWVSCSRTNAVFVIDPATRAAVTAINIDGERPRAMAASPDGSKVYVAIFESGNGTTILGRPLTPLNLPPAPHPADASSHPGRLVNISKRADAVTLAWDSAPGARYILERAAEIRPGSTPSNGWSLLAGPLSAANALTTYTDVLPNTEPQRFYRVRMEP